MLSPESQNPDGATPLDPDEAAELIPGHIQTLAELNEWEQSTIAQAEKWLVSRRRRRASVLSEEFVRSLHNRMFSNTWRWAGQYRRTDRNVGVPWTTIGTRVCEQLENTQFQLEMKSMPLDEIATRLHHGLVSIHPFPNGNGRHARMLTDAFLRDSGAQPFTWGSKSMTKTGEARASYIGALKAADRGDFSALLAFVRT